MSTFAAFAPRARRYASRHRLVSIAGVSIAGASVAAGSWVIGSIGVRTARFVLRWPPARPGAPAQPVTLAATDGSRIAGLYWPGSSESAPGLVMVPGLGTVKEVIAPNADVFAARGYGVLLIDLRGHGASAPALHSFGWHESGDVHGAFAWLKARQRGAKVAVLGISMGAAAAVVGPCGPIAADALILQAPFADLRRAVRARASLALGRRLGARLEPLLSLQARIRIGVSAGRIAPLAGFARYRGPALLIGGGQDEFVPVAEIEEFVAAARQPAELWIAPGLRHNGVSDTLTPAYRARVLDFLETTIGAPH